MKTKLRKGDKIITAYAESANGPGWANSPLWLIVLGEDRALRQECVQPDEQTKEMLALYSVSEAAHCSMTAYTRMAFEKRGH